MCWLSSQLLGDTGLHAAGPQQQGIIAGPKPTAYLGCCVACRNDNQINNRLVLLLSRNGRERTVFWKDIVAGDLVKVGQLGSGVGGARLGTLKNPTLATTAARKA